MAEYCMRIHIVQDYRASTIKNYSIRDKKKKKINK